MLHLGINKLDFISKKKLFVSRFPFNHFLLFGFDYLFGKEPYIFTKFFNYI